MEINLEKVIPKFNISLKYVNLKYMLMHSSKKVYQFNYHYKFKSNDYMQFLDLDCLAEDLASLVDALASDISPLPDLTSASDL